MQLGNIDCCRKLYEKYINWMPGNCYTWIKYAELESSLHEIEQARGIFELAIAQLALDMPESLWKVLELQYIYLFRSVQRFCAFFFPFPLGFESFNLQWKK